MAQIYNTEIVRYASEHNLSYQAAWRALINMKSGNEDNTGSMSDGVTTKFCVKEDVSVPGGEHGTIVDVYKIPAHNTLQYSVMMGSGRVLKFEESELRPIVK